MSLLTSLAPAGIIAFALNLMLHLTILCLIVLSAARRLFRRDPAARHTLCLTGLICLLLAPVAVGLEAKAGYGLITLALPSTSPAAPVAEKAEKSEMILVPVETPYRVAISAALPSPPSTAWKGWVLLSAYLVGVSYGVLRFAHGCRTALRLKRDVSPWRAPSDSQALRTVEQALRAPLPPVFTSPHVASPIAIGLLHPAVILPDGLAETLTPQQLRHVLLHECAHVAFRHGLGGLLERIAGVLFWPHPLVRLLCRELARAREEVCDNFASQEDGAPCYARTLLLVAQGIDIAPNLASTLALLGTGTSLEARISGLLDPRRNRMVSLKRWKLWAVTGTAVVAIGSTAAIRVVAAQEKAAQNPGGVLPGGNSVLRVFAFQYLEANEAAEILDNSITPEQAQQISLSVDSRTNSVIVTSSEPEMVAIAALFARLEAQAAQERAQQDQVPIANPEAQIAKQQAEAEAQRVQAQQAAARAQAAYAAQNPVQTGAVPMPQAGAQTRSAATVKSAPASTVPGKNPKPKATAKQIQLHTKVLLAAKQADALPTKQGAKVKAMDPGSAPPGASFLGWLGSRSSAAGTAAKILQDHTGVTGFSFAGTGVSQGKPVATKGGQPTVRSVNGKTTSKVVSDSVFQYRLYPTTAQGKTTWKVVADYWKDTPVQKSQISTANSETTASQLKSLPKSTAPKGKTPQTFSRRTIQSTQTSTPDFAEVVSKLNPPTLQILSQPYKVNLQTNGTIILKSADEATVKKLLIQSTAPVQTPAQHTPGAPSKTSATFSLQLDKAVAERIALDRLELQGQVQLDKNSTEKLVLEKLDIATRKALGDAISKQVERLDPARPQAEAVARKYQLAEAVDQTKLLQAEYDRLIFLQRIKEADATLAALQAARALEEAARRTVEKNPK